MEEYRISYAQNREDIILSGFFEHVEKGIYVDVGANHPDILSVTKYFYDQGWSGINIEPSPTLFGDIVAQRPRDINLNIGAADKKGSLTLRQYPDGDGLSTFSKATQEDYQKTSSAYKKYTVNYKDYSVEVRRLKDIFEEYADAATEINFMNIDVEGFEYQVIKGNDWTKYRPQVLCIEANHIVEDWRPLLKDAQYDLVFFNGLNNYYVAHEHPAIARNFSYVSTLLLDKPVIAAHLAGHIKNLEIHLEHKGVQVVRLQNKHVRQELVEEGLRVEISNLYAQQASNKRLRSLIKHVVVGINGAILVQIEKLNKPKLLQHQSIDLDEPIEKAALLVRIKQYDMDRYYNSGTTHPILYRIMHTTYTTLYRSGKAVVRKAIRSLKVVKNG